VRLAFRRLLSLSVVRGRMFFVHRSTTYFCSSVELYPLNHRNFFGSVEGFDPRAWR
jgi:hypothetical protein